MKKLILLTLFAAIGWQNSLSGQVEFGAKVGFHSFDISNPKDIILPGDASIAFRDAKMGFQGGFYTRFGLGRVFIEPRLMLNSTKVEYTFNGESGGLFNNIQEESFTNLDIPLIMGFDFLFITGLIGPVAHLNLNTTSDLFDIAGYDQRFKTATYGFRAGICISLGNLDFSMEYEGNFSEFGDHINIGGNQFSFDDTPSRLIFNLGIPIF